VYQEKGLPKLPASMLAELREYQEEVDSVKVFLKEHLVPAENCNVPVTELFQVFRQQEDMSMTIFGTRVKKLSYNVVRKMCNGQKTTCIVGYAWRDDEVHM
jgi:hypothetical protein